MMEEDLKWTCGKDANLECMGRIGGGGYGIVYKVLFFACWVLKFFLDEL